MRLIRILCAALAIPNLLTGSWAVLAPQSWYDDFPGWAPRLVSAYPPFNEHLATDAGAGLLATGFVAGAAALWPRRDVIITAMAAYAVFATPHALFHLVNPSPGDAFTTSEAIVNSGTLAVAAVVSLGVLASQLRTEPA